MLPRVTVIGQVWSYVSSNEPEHKWLDGKMSQHVESTADFSLERQGRWTLIDSLSGQGHQSDLSTGSCRQMERANVLTKSQK